MMKNKKKIHIKQEDGGDSEIMLEVMENQVLEVREIMRENIEKICEREGKLEDLESRAEMLSEQTVEFGRLAKKVQTKSKRNTRRICCIIVSSSVASVVLLLLILFLSFYFYVWKEDDI